MKTILIFEPNKELCEALGNFIGITSKKIHQKDILIDELKSVRIDVLLVYYDKNADAILDIFQIQKKQSPSTLFIVISETGYETELSSLSKNGINNFIAKDKLKFIEPYIKRISEDKIKINETLNEILNNHINLSGISEMIFNSISRHKITGELIYATPGFYELSGYSEDELVGKTMDFLIHDEDKSKADIQNEAILNNQIIRSDYRIIRKDGSITWVEAIGKLILDPNTNEPLEIIAISRDATERKNTEEILLNSEERYRVIAETASDVILSIDENYSIQFINPAIKKMFGYEPDEILNKSIELLLPEYLRGEKRNSIYEYLNTKEKDRNWINLETLGIHKSGRVFAIEISFGEYIIQNNTKLIICIIRDVDERRRMQNLLLESTHRLSLIFNSTSDLMFLTEVREQNYFYISVNQSFLNANALEANHVIGKNINEILPNSVYLKAIEKLNDCVNKNEIIKYEDSFILHNKFNTVETTLIPILNQDGVCTKVLGTSKDITEQKKAIALLTQSESRFRLLAENATDIISKHDLDGFYFYVSNASLAILGYHPDEMIGKCAYDFLHPDDLLDISSGVKGLIDANIDLYTASYRYKKKDNSYIWVESTNKLLINDITNEIDGIISVSRDISDRKLFEKKLEDKIKELDTFIYRSSHDLKGPLSSLLGLINIAKLELSEAKSIEYMSLIEKSVRHLDSILMDLLNITKINQGNLNLVGIDINTLILESIDSFRNLPEFENAEVKYNSKVNEITYFDLSLLKNVLHNLIINAIKYKDSKKTSHQVNISAEIINTNMLITISDNGEGIDEEIQNHIFEMFFRGNTKSTGSGLGLYIAKNAAEKLGGSIELYSKIGEGTTFKIFLPINQSYSR